MSKREERERERDKRQRHRDRDAGLECLCLLCPVKSELMTDCAELLDQGPFFKSGLSSVLRLMDWDVGRKKDTS